MARRFLTRCAGYENTTRKQIVGCAAGRLCASVFASGFALQRGLCAGGVRGLRVQRPITRSTLCMNGTCRLGVLDITDCDSARFTC